MHNPFEKNLRFEDQKSFKNRHLQALRNAEHYLRMALREYELCREKNSYDSLQEIACARFNCYDIVQRMRFSKR